MGARPRHSIGVVSRRTGLKPGLIRAWERRYGVVEPGRSEGNQRLYSDADIDRLLLLREATRRGRTIGQVADLANEGLEELIEQDERAERDPAFGGSFLGLGIESPASEEAEEVTESIIDLCLAGVRRLDARGLEAQLERASVALGRLGVVVGVLGPLLSRVGDLWAAGELRPVHEHLAAVSARGFLRATWESYPPTSGSPPLVAATLEGQTHELGALMAAAIAAAQGWDVTYLGADLPAEELAVAVRQLRARVLALSFVYPADDRRMAERVGRLSRALPTGARVLAGGSAVGGYRGALESAGFEIVPSLDALRQRLVDLRRPAVALS